MKVSNIFDILKKEELRKNDLNAELFSTDVLKIPRPIFDRLKNAFYGHKLLLLMIRK